MILTQSNNKTIIKPAGGPGAYGLAAKKNAQARRKETIATNKKNNAKSSYNAKRVFL